MMARIVIIDDNGAVLQVLTSEDIRRDQHRRSFCGWMLGLIVAGGAESPPSCRVLHITRDAGEVEAPYAQLGLQIADRVSELSKD
jgi:hypothetical protein